MTQFCGRDSEHREYLGLDAVGPARCRSTYGLIDRRQIPQCLVHEALVQTVVVPLPVLRSRDQDIVVGTASDDLIECERGKSPCG